MNEVGEQMNVLKEMTNQDVYVYNLNPNRTEVIGNIFDNLDLLA